MNRMKDNKVYLQYEILQKTIKYEESDWFLFPKLTQKKIEERLNQTLDRHHFFP